MTERRELLAKEYSKMWLELSNPTRITEEEQKALQEKEEELFANDFSQNDLDCIVQLTKSLRDSVCQ